MGLTTGVENVIERVERYDSRTEERERERERAGKSRRADKERAKRKSREREMERLTKMADKNYFMKRKEKKIKEKKYCCLCIKKSIFDAFLKNHILRNQFHSKIIFF